MTISSTPSEVRYATDGVTTSFPIPFVFNTTADLKVLLTDEDGNISELTTGFTATGGNGSTGTLVFAAAPAANQTLTILDDPEVKQSIDYVSNDAFPAETHERGLDYLTRLVKRLSQQNSRALRTRDGDPLSGDDLILPSVQNRASRLMAFDADGKPEPAAAVDVPIEALTRSLIGALLYPQTPAENAAGVTPSDYAVAPQNALPLRYGATGDGTTDDTAALAATAAANQDCEVDLGGLTYRVSATLPASAVPAGVRFLNGNIICDQTQNVGDNYSNVAIGPGALMKNEFVPEQYAAGGGVFWAAGNHNTAFGYAALSENTSGRRNTAIGSRALFINSTGYYNTAIGSHTLRSNVDGNENVALGVQAMQENVDGNENVAIGNAALLSNTSGNYNVAVGRQALLNSTTANGNTAVGRRAMLSITTGANNVAVGEDALSGNTDGFANTVVGDSAAGAAAGFAQVTAIGYRAANRSTANNITAIGADALVNNTSGTANTAVGYSALATNETGVNNTAVGDLALTASTGDNNTAVGKDALYVATTGSRNTAVGYGALSTLTTADNCTGIGYNAQTTGSNQVQLGDSNATTYVYGSVQSRSDARDKADVRDTVLGLEFILKLRPVDFRWDYREDYGWREKDGSKKRKRFHHGLIAQEVQEVIESLGVEFGGLQDHSKAGGKDVLSIGYTELIAPLIKAVQELSARVAELEQRVA